MVTQISVFLPNRAGQLAKITAILMKEEVNIRALTVSETADYGILRMIVSNPGKATKALQAASFLVDETDVIACELKDKPGGLNEIANVLGKASINIEYLYAFVGKSSQAILILRVENQAQASAIDALERGNITIYSPEHVYGL